MASGCCVGHPTCRTFPSGGNRTSCGVVTVPVLCSHVTQIHLNSFKALKGTQWCSVRAQPHVCLASCFVSRRTFGFLESHLSSSLHWAFLCSAGQGGVTTKSDFPNVSPCSTMTLSDLLANLSLSQSPPFSDVEILKPISSSRCPD